MKIKTIFVIAGVLCCSVPSQATEALQDIQTYSQVGFLDEEVGFSFLTGTNLTVTNLGYRFKASAQASSYVVRLLNVDGAEIAAVTLTAPAAATNQLIYTNIPPVQLDGGTTNFVVAYDSLYFATNTIKHWDGAIIDLEDSNTGSFTVASELTYLGATSSTNLLAGTNSPNYLLAGPNFGFTTEPVVIAQSYLVISLTSSNTVQLLWPASDTLGQLQSAPDLSQTWLDVTNTPVVIATNNVVELPLGTNALFRLGY